MPLIVTGIAPDGNAAAVERALEEAQLPAARFSVIEPGGELPRNPARGGGGGPILGSGLETGTGVPGLTGRGSLPMPGTPFARDAAAAERLAALEIPDDEVDNYLEALEAGRTIVAYFATPETLAAASAVFRAAGLAKVKVF